MARQSGNSLFGSLRGKIWVSTSVLAFFICTFGLISYLVVSLLINDPFYGVFIPFLLLAFAVMLFGWWLSNEVVNPVEKVILLAKSLERSSSTTIPRTSGSTETDQLLETIQRNNQQMQKIVTLMDKVANGNLDIAPIQGSDRFSTSFQKLLVKVSESIHAKEELDELKSAINDLKMNISAVRSGNLDAEIRNEYSQTREISETIKYLLDNMSRLITEVRDGAESTEAVVKRVEEEIQTLITKDEVRVQDMAQASIALKQVPNLINKITEDLMGSAKSARQSIEKARHGTQIANQNSTSVSSLRKQVREDVKRIQSLNERSHDIEKVAKTVEDLASRTNMIALNASIQATEMGEDGHGFVLVAEEVERLAARANGTNKQISTLNKSILAEIAKVENSAETTMSEVASLSKYAIETGNVLSEMERYVAHFLNLQENLIAYSKDQSEETDNAFKTFAESITETETTVAKLKEAGVELSSVSRLVRDMNLSVGEFRISENVQFYSSDESDDIEPDAYDGADSNDDFSKKFVNGVFQSASPAVSNEADEGPHDISYENGEFEPSHEGTPEDFDSDVYLGADMDESETRPADGYDESFSEQNEEYTETGQSIEADLHSGNQENSPSAYLKDISKDDEAYENGVLDIFKASYDAGQDPSLIDSDEFSSDELIRESAPEEEHAYHEFDASDSAGLEMDESGLEKVKTESADLEEDSSPEFGVPDIAAADADNLESDEFNSELAPDEEHSVDNFDPAEFDADDLIDESGTAEQTPVLNFDAQDTRVIETDEFDADDLIEESDPAVQTPVLNFDAQDTRVIETDEFDADDLIDESDPAVQTPVLNFDAQDTRVIETDEFDSDDLIEESDPEALAPVHSFDATESTVVNSDDFDDLLDIGAFSPPAADKDLTA